MTKTNSWIPSRKWMATLTTALAALAVAWVNAGDWNKTLTIALVGCLAQSIAGYLVPNLTDGQEANDVTTGKPAGTQPAGTTVTTG